MKYLSNSNAKAIRLFILIFLICCIISGVESRGRGINKSKLKPGEAYEDLPINPVIEEIIYGIAFMIPLCCFAYCAASYLVRNCRTKVDIEPYFAVALAKIHNKDELLRNRQFV